MITRINCAEPRTQRFTSKHREERAYQNTTYPQDSAEELSYLKAAAVTLAATGIVILAETFSKKGFEKFLGYFKPKAQKLSNDSLIPIEAKVLSPDAIERHKKMLDLILNSNESMSRRIKKMGVSPDLIRDIEFYKNAQRGIISSYNTPEMLNNFPKGSEERSQIALAAIDVRKNSSLLRSIKKANA